MPLFNNTSINVGPNTRIQDASKFILEKDKNNAGKTFGGSIGKDGYVLHVGNGKLSEADHTLIESMKSARNEDISVGDFKQIIGKQVLFDLIEKEHGTVAAVNLLFGEGGHKDFTQPGVVNKAMVTELHEQFRLRSATITDVVEPEPVDYPDDEDDQNEEPEVERANSIDRRGSQMGDAEDVDVDDANVPMNDEDEEDDEHQIDRNRNRSMSDESVTPSPRRMSSSLSTDHEEQWRALIDEHNDVENDNIDEIDNEDDGDEELSLIPKFDTPDGSIDGTDELALFLQEPEIVGDDDYDDFLTLNIPNIDEDAGSLTHDLEQLQKKQTELRQNHDRIRSDIEQHYDVNSSAVTDQSGNNSATKSVRDEFESEANALLDDINSAAIKQANLHENRARIQAEFESNNDSGSQTVPPNQNRPQTPLPHSLMAARAISDSVNNQVEALKAQYQKTQDNRQKHAAQMKAKSSRPRRNTVGSASDLQAVQSQARTRGREWWKGMAGDDDAVGAKGACTLTHAIKSARKMNEETGVYNHHELKPGVLPHHHNEALKNAVISAFETHAGSLWHYDKNTKNEIAIKAIAVYMSGK